VGANNFVPKIILGILMAVVVWAVVFFVGFWARHHPLLSITISIVSAIVFSVIAMQLTDKKVIPENASLPLVALGSAITLLVSPLLAPGPGIVRITVTCSQTPTANPDETIAYTGAVITWLPSNVGYTVEFKQSNLNDPQNGQRRSPVKKVPPQVGEEITIQVTSSNQSRTVDVLQGYFWYNITCANGYHVDPKVKVPPAI
jgi:hypothetical protein